MRLERLEGKLAVGMPLTCTPETLTDEYKPFLGVVSYLSVRLIDRLRKRLLTLRRFMAQPTDRGPISRNS